jgi:sarcosine oxidase gamma subunit
LCWYVTREITANTRDARASDANDGDVFTDVASDLITCAIEGAEACRAVARGDALDGSADVAPANWSSVLLRCAGQVRPGGAGVP